MNAKFILSIRVRRVDMRQSYSSGSTVNIIWWQIDAGYRVLNYDSSTFEKSSTSERISFVSCLPLIHPYSSLLWITVICLSGAREACYTVVNSSSFFEDLKWWENSLESSRRSNAKCKIPRPCDINILFLDRPRLTLKEPYEPREILRKFLKL